jgi:hypothetical protein
MADKSLSDLPDTRPGAGTNDDGVDVSLVRWMLTLTPTERLARLQAFVDGVWKIRHGADRP